MKKIVVLLSLTLSLNVWAGPHSEMIKQTLESLSSCENFVRLDQRHIFLGFGAYKIGFEEPRSAIPGELQVVALGPDGASWTAYTQDSVIDALTVGDRLLVLTYSGIEDWSLSTRKRTALYPTRFGENVLAYREHARAFALYNDKLIIAHGRKGVTFFDLNTNRIVNQLTLIPHQLPVKESQAMSVLVEGTTAYVLLDAFSITPNGKKPPFRGIVKIDMNTERVVGELDGLDPGADALMIHKDQLLVSFMGMPVQRFPLSVLNGTQLPAPSGFVGDFGVPGHPTGKPVLDDKYYYTCFRKRSESGRGPAVYIPLALDVDSLRK